MGLSLGRGFHGGGRDRTGGGRSSARGRRGARRGRRSGLAGVRSRSRGGRRQGLWRLLASCERVKKYENQNRKELLDAVHGSGPVHPTRGAHTSARKDRGSPDTANGSVFPE